MYAKREFKLELRILLKACNVNYFENSKNITLYKPFQVTSNELIKISML